MDALPGLMCAREPKVCDVLAKKLPRRGRAGQFFESKKCRARFKKLPRAGHVVWSAMVLLHKTFRTAFARPRDGADPTIIQPLRSNHYPTIALVLGVLECWSAGWLELEGEDSICKAEGWHPSA